MKSKICGIYKITNLINGKFYIGSSNDIHRRWKEHINELNRNVHCNKYLQKSYNKYGIENFEFTIIEVCSEDEQIIREQYWIDITNCYDKNIGYNLSKSASKVVLERDMFEERNKKIAITQIGENNSFCKHTEQEIKKVIEDIMNPNLSWQQIMKRNNIKKGTIQAIITGHNWNHLTKDLVFPKRNTVCKLTEEDVKEIIELLLKGYRDEYVAERFNVSKITISNIRLYKTWKHLTKNIDFNKINNNKQKGGINQKLPLDIVISIKKDINNNIRNIDIAEKYHISPSVVSSIKTGRSYMDVAI